MRKANFIRGVNVGSGQEEWDTYYAWLDDFDVSHYTQALGTHTVPSGWIGRTFYRDSMPGFFVLTRVMHYPTMVTLTDSMDKGVTMTMSWEQFLANYKEKL